MTGPCERDSFLSLVKEQVPSQVDYSLVKDLLKGP